MGRSGGLSRLLPARHARLVATTTVALLVAALAAYPLLVAGKLTSAVAPLGVLGVSGFAVAVLRSGRFLAPGLLALAAEYVVVEVTGRASAVSVVAVATGLVLACELVYWAVELPADGAADAASVVAEALTLAATGVAAALLALVTLATGSLRVAGAFEAALVGVPAAIGLLALPLLLLRRADLDRAVPSDDRAG